ncbi:MAG: porin [Betaproteobacteria bacterium]|nr:MAG: porin [Betaproteobacteria bacterium]
MNGRVLVAAVAAAFSLPAVALAQSSVTLSGIIKMAFENVKLSQSAKTPSGESRVADESSKIVFQVVEDLGSGLHAIVQVDWRVTPDSGADAASGNNWVGLRSRDWGTLALGRFDLHYQNSPSEIAAKGGSYKAQNIALLAFAGGGATAIAGNTRTTNAVRYDSPDWNGLAVSVAYSTNPAAPEADLGSGVRKGRAWNVVPTYTADRWQLGWSNWNSKPDAFASPDQRGDRLWGYYQWGGLKLGLAWDRAKLATGATGVLTSNRTAWSVPLRYTSGRHNVYAEYSKARDDKATVASDGARMFAIAYAYDLSKRTSAGITYARIANDAGAFYNLYNSAAGQGSASAAVAAGEDPRIWSFALRHAF